MASSFSRNSGNTRGSNVACTWQCIWAFAMAASMLVFSLALLGPSCPRTSSSSTTTGASTTMRKNLVSQDRSQLQILGKVVSSAEQWSGDLRSMEVAWNRLCFGSPPDDESKLRIALFVKKWPVGGVPGGLERHALTLHRVLASRGHDVHVYTTSAGSSRGIEEEEEEDMMDEGLQVHFLRATAGGTFDYNRAWQRFVEANSSKEFDIVHSESVALPHWKARYVENLAASWHGIGYEIIHSELVQDLVRRPGEARSIDLQRVLNERLGRVAEEIKFFPSYRHHVATSDYVADVLQTIYEIPLENVHTILNGVDEKRFAPNPSKGAAFRKKYGIPMNATLVMGAAGRLVKDKGHPLLFEAFSRILLKNKGIFLLIAGHGPWGERYRELAPNVKTLGNMAPSQLADFYNAIDIFVNPTLRSQGLDHTLLEAMQSGKALLATHFSSITWSVIISKDFGYTFSPNVASLTKALEAAIGDGKEVLKIKGKMCFDYAQLMFTAAKMGSAYERLFYCIRNPNFCHYPLPFDCPIQSSNY